MSRRRSSRPPRDAERHRSRAGAAPSRRAATDPRCPVVPSKRPLEHPPPARLQLATPSEHPRSGPRRPLRTTNGSATWPDPLRPVHRHDVGACKLAIGGSSSTVAVATRQSGHSASGVAGCPFRVIPALGLGRIRARSGGVRRAQGAAPPISADGRSVRAVVRFGPVAGADRGQGRAGSRSSRARAPRGQEQGGCVRREGGTAGRDGDRDRAWDGDRQAVDLRDHADRRQGRRASKVALPDASRGSRSASRRRRRTRRRAGRSLRTTSSSTTTPRLTGCGR
jgi:hypothetical protein